MPRWACWLHTVPLMASGAAPMPATGYFVSNAGSDANDGRSPATAWCTLGHVSAQEFAPGDVIRLRRGDVWREPLRPCSGSAEGPVTYSAYGEGPKPLLLGSVAKGEPAGWQHQGGNIWSTVPPRPVGPEILADPSLTEGAGSWMLYTEGGAAAGGNRDAEEFTSAPAAYRLDCTQSGEAPSDIQFFTRPFRVEAGRVYRLSLSARGTQPVVIESPRLMSSGPPWTRYSLEPIVRKQIGADWAPVTQYYQATITADDARLTIFLGGLLPAGATLILDDLSLRECEGELLPADVGNLILNREALCGVKVWNEADLAAQGQYRYDEDNQLLKVYSVGNPAAVYSAIECALRIHQIDQSNCSYVIYEQLALKYGAAHGIGGANTHHIIVRDCDFGFIGGGDQMGGDATVRFGNGIEFWAGAHDNLVERCRLWEIYDAALTNQSMGGEVEQVNITYRNNVIRNSEYSFEYWNRPTTSVTRHIVFEHNTCVGAGHGWGHAQRPDPSGRHLCFYTSDAQAQDIVIRNNVFYEATSNAFYAPTWPPEGLAALRMDGNCWYQAEGTMIALQGREYTMADFAAYQEREQAEPHSLVADPRFVALGAFDFHLTPGSSCVDAGVPSDVSADYDGVRRPQGGVPDIGAYEVPRG